MELIWKKLKEKNFKAGWRKMINKTFELPNGKKMDYDIKDEGQSAVILALTPDNKVLLEKVFRPGPEIVLMELPAGFIENNEDPKVSAERELLEETGYKGEMEFVTKVVDDAYSNCIRHVFVAINCVKIKEPKLEEDEIFELVLMDITDFRDHLKSGQMCDVEAGYLALDHLKLL